MACPLCATDPSTLVFRKVAEKSTHSVYYTYPSKIKPGYSAEQIIEHYAHRLQEKGPKPWIWVIDGTQFDTDHVMDFKTGMGISELLTGIHCESLLEVKIINPTIHLKVLRKVIQPFMEDALKEKIVLLDDRSRSILEFL